MHSPHSTTQSSAPAALRDRLHSSYEQHALARRLDDITLRDLFNKLTRHLPHGRVGLPSESSFTNAQRTVDPIAPRGLDLREILTEVVNAAVATGDAKIVAATQLEVTRYLDQIKTQAFAAIPEPDAPHSIALAVVDSIKEGAEAVACLGEAGTTRSTSTLERADREVDEAVASFHRVKRVIGQHLRAGQRQSMHA